MTLRSEDDSMKAAVSRAVLQQGWWGSSISSEVNVTGRGMSHTRSSHSGGKALSGGGKLSSPTPPPSRSSSSSSPPPLVSSLLKPSLLGFAVVLLATFFGTAVRDWRGQDRAFVVEAGPDSGATSSSRAASPLSDLSGLEGGGGGRPLGVGKGWDVDPMCLLEGRVADCSCNYFQVEALNEEVVRPKLQEIVGRRFFSYFKVDLHCKCPFWPEDGMCSMPACSVCECQDDQLPKHFLQPSDVLECRNAPSAGGPGTLVDASDSKGAASLSPSSPSDAGEAGIEGASPSLSQDAIFSEKWESQVDRTVAVGVGRNTSMAWQATDNPWLFNTNEKKGGALGAKQEDFVYVDLHLNPERYTGYKGEHANRIWRAIYSQSCFHGLREDGSASDIPAHISAGSGGGVGSRPGAFPGLLLPQESAGHFGGGTDGQVVCKEKEVFYRLISGIHASITAHIAAEHPKEICDGPGGIVAGMSSSMAMQSARPMDSGSPFHGFGGVGGGGSGGGGGHGAGGSECRLDERHWGPNLRVFYDRLGKKDFKARVENLYFVYLFTLQAAVKAAPYLAEADYATDGVEDEDAYTRTIVKSLLGNKRLTQMCTKAFDEGMLWKDNESAHLQQEMQSHFQNITQIMNCVGCEKCKLWGKLQMLGVGTALKILFSVEDISRLVLTRNEVISLFNLLARLSESIHSVSTMLCTLIDKGYQDVLVPPGTCN
uniref:Endoplasmic reticulum oxidoreductin 1 n=1 Tax=Chloropicon laureae TaxID=464258 RepID=A0A7S2Z0W6_9CHLO|mmetsp:Transcript_13680/g.35316  ORF Transcript_13680/g.35316 Transcript_13680/m.35316 type:complete len:711 (+) Transcript_13680:171-2303(+)